LWDGASGGANQKHREEGSQGIAQESKFKLLYLQNIKLERQYPHCETKWMWIGINQLGTIPRIDGLTGKSGFIKDGVHPKRLYPCPLYFPLKI
jgi:hypothetical protein